MLIRADNEIPTILVTQAIERLTSRPSPQPSPPAAHPPVSQPNESAVPYDQPSCSVPVDLIPPPQHTRKSSRLSSSSPTVPLPTPKIDDFPIPKPGTSRRPIPENRRITRSLSRQDSTISSTSNPSSSLSDRPMGPTLEAEKPRLKKAERRKLSERTTV